MSLKKDFDKYFGIKKSKKTNKNKKIKFTSQTLNEAEILNGKEKSKLNNQIKHTFNNLEIGKLEKIKYTVLTKNDAIKISTLDIKNESDLNSPQLGIIGRRYKCPICRMTSIECPGHHGIIDLEDNMILPLFRQYVIYTLQSICENCAIPYLDDNTLEEDENIIGKKGIKRLLEISKKSKNKTCINCGRINNIEYSTQKNTGKDMNWNIIGMDKKSKNIVAKSPSRIKQTFSNISDYHCKLLGYEHNKPINFVSDFIWVMPTVSRPEVFREGISKNDCITDSYTEILKLLKIINNDEIKNINVVKDDILINYAAIIEGRSQKSNDGNYRNISMRLKGKEGHIRNHLLGKRNDFSARTVLGPNKNLCYGELAISYFYRNNLTIPEKITIYNKSKILNLAKKGDIEYIISDEGKKLFKTDRFENFDLIKVGNTVYRRIQDGKDHGLFNRQPTLHINSLLSYVLRFHDKETTGLHISSTAGHNADFDGDEGNLFLPQTIDSRVEAKLIMTPENNLISKYSSMPTTGIIFNGLVGAYKLSEDILSEEDFEEGINLLKNKFTNNINTLYKRIDELEIEGYTINKLSGKVLISILLPQNFIYDGKININDMDKDSDSIEKDVYIKIRKGIIIEGILGKKNVGINGNSIIHKLAKFYSKEEAVDFISYGNFLFNWYIQKVGQSITLYDCKLNDYKVNMEKIYKEMDELNQSIEKLEPLDINASSIEKYLREKEIKKKINNRMNKLNFIVAKNINKDNNIIQIANSGAKGKLSDMIRIVGFLGQQYLNSSRIEKTLNQGKRTLYTFDINDRSIYSEGFNKNSFFKGMTANETFIHSMAARLNLIDTAVGTADVGDTQRKTIKAQEDLVVKYDGTVRNNRNIIFKYDFCGGFAPEKCIKVNGEYSFIDINYVIDILHYKDGVVEFEQRLKKILN